MEKLIFLFRRKPDASRADFFEHYIGVHAPLGMRHKQGLSGYTVNLVASDAEVDAVTEIWTPSIASFTGSGVLGDGDRAIIADHLSFMGPQDGYGVAETVLRDGPLSPFVALQEGRDTKIVSLIAAGTALPDPPEAAFRVVDNVVKTVIFRRDQRINRAPVDGVDLGVIRSCWTRAAEAGAPLPQGSVRVREFRNREVA
jgi:hypothetical protein